MPLLPLPIGGAGLAGGDLPVSDESDVLAALPAFLRPDDPAEVRDGIVAALTQILLTWQDRSEYSAAQSDILRAVGPALDEILNELGVFRQLAEEDEPYRARGLTTPSLVTPAALLAAAGTILAPYTATLPQYSEAASDRLFVGGSAPRDWCAGIYKAATKPVSPRYPDRLYPMDAASNGGYVRPQSEPGAARVYSDTVGRYLLLRVPDISAIDQQVAAVYSSQNAAGFFAGAGTSFSFDNTNFVRRSAASAKDVYAAIVNAIDRIKGASIRWQLLVDPNL